MEAAVGSAGFLEIGSWLGTGVSYLACLNEENAPRTVAHLFERFPVASVTFVLLVAAFITGLLCGACLGAAMVARFCLRGRRQNQPAKSGDTAPSSAALKGAVQAVAELKQQSEAFAELRAAHAALQDETSKMRAAMMQDEATRAEREAEVAATIKDHELNVSRMETDLTEARRRQLEIEAEYREHAIRADGLLQPLKIQVQDLSSRLSEEQERRKQIHNQVQDMKGAIRVYARVRPLNANESGNVVALRKFDAFSLEAVSAAPSSTPRTPTRRMSLMSTPRASPPRTPTRMSLTPASIPGRGEFKTFTFDSVFDERSSQEDVFNECSDLVSSAVDGFNVTIFAYGQTGAGKTHTMFGSQEDPGVVPRATAELFRLISGRTATVRCCMFELYRDDLVDLTFPNVTSTSRSTRGMQTKASHVLEVKHDARGSVYVEGATEREVSSLEELQAVIREGRERRHVAATKLNIDSSRSHLIVIITVETIDQQTQQVATGKLTLCDLAGSERLKKSGSVGEQLKEAQSINRALSALGDVIESITQGAKHVPYRNHKLTMLLSDSIGGSAKTLMLVNCSPSALSTDETISSLNYAVRLKLISNKVERSHNGEEVSRLKKTVQALTQELDEVRGAVSIGSELPEYLPAERRGGASRGGA